MTREEAIRIIEDARAVVLANGEYDEAMRMAIEALKAEPKHGRWIKGRYRHKETLEAIDGATCSECGAIYRRYQRAELGYDAVVPNYCPNCGAKMDPPEAQEP